MEENGNKPKYMQLYHQWCVVVVWGLEVAHLDGEADEAAVRRMGLLLHGRAAAPSPRARAQGLDGQAL